MHLSGHSQRRRHRDKTARCALDITSSDVTNFGHGGSNEKRGHTHTHTFTLFRIRKHPGINLQVLCMCIRPQNDTNKDKHACMSCIDAHAHT